MADNRSVMTSELLDILSVMLISSFLKSYLVYDDSCPRKGCDGLFLGRGEISEYLEAPLVPFDAVYLLPLP